MALLSNKGFPETEFIDLLLENVSGLTEGSCDHGNQDWTITDKITLCHGESGADHFLDSLLNVGDSASSPRTPLWASSPCDSGISEDPPSDHLDSPPPSASPLLDALFFPPHHQYHHASPLQQQLLGQCPMEAGELDVSIDLAAWESSLFLGQPTDTQCIPGNQRTQPSPYQLTVKDLLLSNISEPPKQSCQQSLQELVLNDDEKKLLAKEGVSLPSQLPLTKYEEKILQKIRRKIRNKQSAQDSRKKKKEYIDGLEGRMAACSAQNLELQRKVLQLEKTNTSLLEQLRGLQTLVMSGSNKPVQTGTCVLVLLLSFSLILFPSLQPVSQSKANELGDFSVARVQSRSLRAVVQVQARQPVFSVESEVDSTTAMLSKLQARSGYADMDPLPHNRSYDDQEHIHSDPITGRVATLSWSSHPESRLHRREQKGNDDLSQFI